ncbi:MAG: pyrimidine 5'-nucleotidase [Azovibrio sp.]|uniref:pyrimidine 5'-nucleotidase n=1 Tax=Azovibrio sp. TaxID=1872673 RepID=UPI003C76B5E9
MTARLPRPPRPVWLFDLDNTLHDASPHIFPHINRAMQTYIETHLQVDAEEAGRIRQTYWQRYGATLLGLMRHHDTDPRHFLWETHQFPELPRMLVFERAVNAMLGKLPGRKILYSNAPAHYTEAVLDLTGMARHFDAVYPVEATRFQPKPDPRGLRRLLRAENLQAHQCILVEDSLPNLRTAKRLGTRTVWISRASRCPPYVDARLRSVLELPRYLRQL